MLALLALVGSGTARADGSVSLVPELRLGAGYDDNLFLDASPQGVPSSQVRADAIFDVEPRVAARLSVNGHTLLLQADYLERITVANQDLRDLTLRLDYLAPRLGPLQLLAAAVYEHYAADLYPTDTFDLAGGELGARLFAGSRVRLETRYRVDARAYSNPARSGQLDLEQRAWTGLHARLHPVLDVEVGYAYLDLASSLAQATLDRHRVEAGVQLRPVDWLLLVVGYGFSRQALPATLLAGGAAGPRVDLWHSVDVELSARPLRWLEVYARYQLIDSSSTDPSGSWRRNQVLAGLVLFYDFQRQWIRTPPQAPSVAPEGVTFRYRGPATRVSVVGDWNGWDPLAAPLTPVGGGRFEGKLRVPSGRHEYALSVDGKTVSPPDAPGHTADGFGGENGVLQVP